MEDNNAPPSPPPSPSTDRLRRFGQLSERQAEQIDHGYSRRVRRLRLLLPILALGIVGIVFAWPQMGQIKPTPAPLSPVSHKRTASNELIKPKFMGQDNNNQPYTVTADSAVQSTDDPDTVLLTQPRGHTTMPDGMSIHVEAAKGTYRQKAQRLTLENKVRLSDTQGYHLQSERVTIDMIAHKAWTDRPVEGGGPSGTIKATGLQADTVTGVLIFTGPATLVLNNAMKGF